MNMIAAVTVIRGQGGCQALMNGIVNEEMQKLNERHAKEMARTNAELEAAKAHRNRLLKDALKRHETSEEKRGIASRIKDGIVFAWCCLWAWAFEWGLIEEDEEIKAKEGADKRETRVHDRVQKSTTNQLAENGAKAENL